MATAFGEYFRGLRARLNMPLRQFCIANGYDPGNISRLERGLLAPPTADEKLRDYARALKIKKGSDEWITFFDLAAVARRATSRRSRRSRCLAAALELPERPRSPQRHLVPP